MKIVLTGSISQIGKPLTKELIDLEHEVTVISSRKERIADIEALGAQAAIGSMYDEYFLTETFQNADIVYLMETHDAVGDMFDKSLDFIGNIKSIAKNYKQAVIAAAVKKIVHLSSIGAHMQEGNGILKFHTNSENILNELPDDVAIKFMRPVGFYTNMYSFIPTIKSKGMIISNYGGDKKEPWVAPLDIAEVIVEEMNKPFEGRMIRYIASDEVSPNEIAQALGKAIGKPDLKWKVVSSEDLLQGWLSIGFNQQIAEGFVEMQEKQGSGVLYEDYYKHQPKLGKVKLVDFAADFAKAYQND